MTALQPAGGLESLVACSVVAWCLGCSVLEPLGGRIVALQGSPNTATHSLNTNMGWFVLPKAEATFISASAQLLVYSLNTVCTFSNYLTLESSGPLRGLLSSSCGGLQPSAASKGPFGFNGDFGERMNGQQV